MAVRTRPDAASPVLVSPIREGRGTSRPSLTRREPRYVAVQPYRQRVTLAQRGVVGGPVRHAVAGRAMAPLALTAENRLVNPLRQVVQKGRL